MKIIAHAERHELLVSMTTTEWEKLRYIQGFHYPDNAKKEIGTITEVSKIGKSIEEIETIKGLKKDISGMMSKWEKASSFIAERLSLEKGDKK